MPTYVFTDEDGKSHEVVLTIAGMLECELEEEKFDVPGLGICKRNYAAEQGGFQNTSGCWPMHCDASGVDPSQAKAAHDKSVRDGVPTHFDKAGRAIYESRSHRSKYLRSIGMFDRNAGYSDPAPRNV